MSTSPPATSGSQVVRLSREVGGGCQAAPTHVSAFDRLDAEERPAGAPGSRLKPPPSSLMRKETLRSNIVSLSGRRSAGEEEDGERRPTSKRVPFEGGVGQNPRPVSRSEGILASSASSSVSTSVASRVGPTPSSSSTFGEARKKTYVMVRTLSDGTKIREKIRADDPILDKVPLRGCR